MNIYDFINWFLIYSFLGYLLRCIVLSAEYKQPVMDRGFGRNPFCVIHGLNTLGVCMLLWSVSDSPMKLYTASTAIATIMELVTANIMVRLFDSFWWDYGHKLFNYKGIACLESNLTQGLLGLSFSYFLDIRVHVTVISLPDHVGTVLVVGPTMSYLVDLIHYFRLRIGGMEEEDGSAAGWPRIY